MHSIIPSGRSPSLHRQFTTQGYICRCWSCAWFSFTWGSSHSLLVEQPCWTCWSPLTPSAWTLSCSTCSPWTHCSCTRACTPAPSAPSHWSGSAWTAWSRPAASTAAAPQLPVCRRGPPWCTGWLLLQGSLRGLGRSVPWAFWLRTAPRSVWMFGIRLGWRRVVCACDYFHS